MLNFKLTFSASNLRLVTVFIALYAIFLIAIEWRVHVHRGLELPC